MLAPDADRQFIASLVEEPDFATDTICCFSEEVALPGHDGDKAESLLKNSKASGSQVLANLSRKALNRTKVPYQILALNTLFNEKLISWGPS